MAHVRKFRDIISDIDLTRLAADKVHQIRWRDAQMGATNRSTIDVFREAGALLRGKWSAPAATQPGRTAQTHVPTLADWQAAKAALPSTPSAATARAVLGQPERPPRTPSQVVSDMRRRRGLAA